ncbi:MAG: hypothetical protein ACPG7F_14695, partial [Aggregatilineales bacterium]
GDIRAMMRVWAVGMLIIIVTTVAMLLPGDNLLWHNLRLYNGYMLCAIAIAFWLMRRFSRITAAWATMGLHNVAGLLSLAGVLLSIAPLLNSTMPFIGYLTILIAPICAMIFVAHSYRALSDHNGTHTLSAHWTALFVILIFLAIGLATILMIPGIHHHAQHTILIDLPSTLMTHALLAISLAMLNQSIAEMRGINARITGLLPFWCISFGIAAATLSQLLIGVVQVYLIQLFDINPTVAQAALAPLSIMWTISGGFFVMGIIFYALGVMRRRLRFDNMLQ